MSYSLLRNLFNKKVYLYLHYDSFSSINHLGKNKPIPLYFQLKTILIEKIESGEFKPSDQIPSEIALCDKYSISRTTVRQAVGELEHLGMVVRTQGRGTFVARNLFNQAPYRIGGFSNSMEKQGHKPGSIVLQQKVIMPDQEVVGSLQINRNEAVAYLQRIRTLDGKPMGLENSYFPFKRFANLLEEDFKNKSLYTTLTEKYNTIPVRTKASFEAILPTDEVRRLLETPSALPILYITDISFDQNNILFQFNRVHFRGDRYSFLADINRQEKENLLSFKK